MAYEIRYRNPSGVATRKSAEAWQVSGLKRFTNGAGADMMTFYQVLLNATTAALFEEDTQIEVFKDGERWFLGTNLQPNRVLDPRRKRIEYRVVGPWSRFERRVFRQRWGVGLDYTSHLLLNISTSNELLSAKGQIESVIDYMIAQGVEIEKGDILPLEPDGVVYPVPNELVSATCAAVITNQLRWLLRQGIVYWNYAQPNPMMFVRRGDQLPAVTVDIPANDSAKDIVAVNLRPRPDLQLNGVWITYEYTHTIDGATAMGLAIDKYPADLDGGAEDVLHLTFDMQGLNKVSVEQEVTTAPIEASSVEWWKDRLEYLREVSDLTITNVARAEGWEEFPNELLDGGIAEWMDEDLREEVIVALASYTVAGKKKISNKQISVKVRSTTAGPLRAGTEVYSTWRSEQEAEPRPVGLAQFLYELAQPLQYEGTVMLKEQALRLPKDQTPRVGTRLNLTGGRPEWATMNAVIQAVEEDAQSGETLLTVQPLSTMVASDIMELLRVHRRRRWTNPATQLDLRTRANRVLLPANLPKENSSVGESLPSMQVFQSEENSDDATASLKRIDLDADEGLLRFMFGDQQVTFDQSEPAWKAATSKALKVREVDVCVTGANGTPTPMKALVIMSEPYAAT